MFFHLLVNEWARAMFNFHSLNWRVLIQDFEKVVVEVVDFFTRIIYENILKPRNLRQVFQKAPMVIMLVTPGLDVCGCWLGQLEVKR